MSEQGKWFVGEDRRYGWGVHRYSAGGSSHRSAKTEADAQAIFDAMAVNGTCGECGDVLNIEYCEPYKSQIVAGKRCMSCLFWLDYAAKVNDPSSVRVGGRHYWITPDAPRASFQGHGGAEFVIRFVDGREVVTRNLWAQSEIPAHFRERIPDNAEFVTRGHRFIGPFAGYGGAGSADSAFEL